MSTYALYLEITLQNPGLRINIPEQDLDAYRNDPVQYVARRFNATELEVRRYFDCGGTIQCRQIRDTGARCRNIHGVHAAPGQLEFSQWVQLDRVGWYCNVHG